ncbi:MAG: hypothetical protein LBQ89_00310 [Treponema sp.]|jgi:hypothetical protein|nr:hypothetical protein [Treponema sp.]
MFIVTLNIASSLPRSVYKAWNRRSFTKVPDALAGYKNNFSLYLFGTPLKKYRELCRKNTVEEMLRLL